MNQPLTCYIGWDPREVDAYQVAVSSIVQQTNSHISVHPIVRNQCMAMGMYWRPQSVQNNVLWDDISDAPMATEFALTRFLVPHLRPETQWALFMDCDVMAMADVGDILQEADPRYAVMCVKHDHRPREAQKMDNQVQTAYPRKNWSSVMLWNTHHPANSYLTLEAINEWRGLDLHQFRWLPDSLIGGLDQRWNYLVGHSPKNIDPAIVHFTDGVPSMKGYENCEYADIWRSWRREK